MLVKSIAECILSTFIRLPFVINIFVLSIFEWPFYTGFTVPIKSNNFKFNSQLSLNKTEIKSEMLL